MRSLKVFSNTTNISKTFTKDTLGVKVNSLDIPKSIVTDLEKHRVKVSKTKSNSISVESCQNRKTRVSQGLAFRVKFSNIGTRVYSPGNPAPIGIAIIGLNNYIL